MEPGRRRLFFPESLHPQLEEIGRSRRAVLSLQTSSLTGYRIPENQPERQPER
jgi:hypothetical protein